jgi:hypothetical protein
MFKHDKKLKPILFDISFPSRKEILKEIENQVAMKEAIESDESKVMVCKHMNEEGEEDES